jgi:predicted ATP-dependent Lon-type protease
MLLLRSNLNCYGFSNRCPRFDSIELQASDTAKLLVNDRIVDLRYRFLFVKIGKTTTVFLEMQWRSCRMLQRLLSLTEMLERKSVLLLGPRMTGKSTLLQQTLPDASLIDLTSRLQR